MTEEQTSFRKIVYTPVGRNTDEYMTALRAAFEASENPQLSDISVMKRGSRQIWLRKPNEVSLSETHTISKAIDEFLEAENLTSGPKSVNRQQG